MSSYTWHLAVAFFAIVGFQIPLSYQCARNFDRLTVASLYGLLRLCSVVGFACRRACSCVVKFLAIVLGLDFHLVVPVCCEFDVKV